MIDPGIEAVVFDYGGVLTNPVREAFRAWLIEEGIQSSSLASVLASWTEDPATDDSPIHRLETGALEVAEFERMLTSRLTTRHRAPVEAEGALSRAFAAMQPDHAMLDLVRDLKTAGIRLGLLSNSWGNTYPRSLLDDLFDVVVISGEVGLRKPLTPIYELTLRRLDVPANRAVFVDDLKINLNGAETLGMAVMLHTAPARTRAALAAMIPGLPRSRATCRPVEVAGD